MKPLQVLNEIENELANIKADRTTHAQIQQVMQQFRKKYQEPKKEEE